MFKNKNTRHSDAIDTIISPKTHIEGNITHPKSLRIDGKIIGEIHCEGDVFIGTEGKTEQYIRANNLIVSGEVNGDVIVNEKIHIKSTGKLNGSVISKGVIIEEGGVFIGNSKISEKEKNVHIIDNSNDELEVEG